MKYPLHTEVAFHVLLKAEVKHQNELEPLALLQLARQALPPGLIDEPIFLVSTESLGRKPT